MSKISVEDEMLKFEDLRGKETKKQRVRKRNKEKPAREIKRKIIIMVKCMVGKARKK